MLCNIYSVGRMLVNLCILSDASCSDSRDVVCLRRFPNLQSNNGIGIRSKERMAKTLVAHDGPSCSYIRTVKRGNVAPRLYLRAPLAAIAALVSWQSSGNATSGCYVPDATTSAGYMCEIYVIADSWVANY